MFRKNVILVILFLGIVFAVGTLFYSAFFSSEVPPVLSDVVSERVLPHHHTRVSTKAKLGEDRTLLHPLADPAKRDAYRNQPITSWEEWVKARTEIHLGFDVENGFILTLDEVISDRITKNQHYTWQGQRYKKKNHPVPTTAIGLPYLSESSVSKFYEGPQTTEAIMSEFDDKYENSFPRAAEMEENYPRQAFLQRVLDKGAVIKDGSDYVYWMKLRDMLLYRKDRPDDWRSGGYGIPVTTNFAEYEEGFLERKVWENSIIQQVSEANPDQSVEVYFPASHPDVYLPAIDNMTYVQPDEYGGVSAFGAMLTQKQLEELNNKGIEPKNREIIYIDEDYNVLSEKPKPYNHQEWVAKNDYLHVPEGLQAPDGTIVSPERYHEITGQEMPDETRQKYDEYTGAPPAEAFARAEAEREAVRTREVARAEFERFQNEMRQTEKFQSIAASEMSRELATQFLSKYAPKSGTDKQLQTALELMFQHGFEEGLRRLRKDDAGLAAALERQLVEAHRPPKPQLRRQNNVPPKPPETPPASDTE